MSSGGSTRSGGGVSSGSSGSTSSSGSSSSSSGGTPDGGPPPGGRSIPPAVLARKAICYSGYRANENPQALPPTYPTEAEITKILGILEDGGAGPAFVHCQRGADRTGAVIASYRVDHDHWDNARALSEAMDRGMSRFQFPRKSYIRAFQPRTVDSKAAAAKAASEPASASDAVTVNTTSAVSNPSALR